jgi:hypothetical protein
MKPRNMVIRFVRHGGTLVAIACASPQSEVYGHLSSEVVQLPTGDSLELQAEVPAVVEGSLPGKMFVFYPFSDLSDTIRLRHLATALLLSLRARLDSSPPPFVVLRAVNVPAAKRNQIGAYEIEQFGFVVERRTDGQWYFLNQSEPIRQ